MNDNEPEDISMMEADRREMEMIKGFRIVAAVLFGLAAVLLLLTFGALWMMAHP